MFASVAFASPQRPVIVETVHPTADHVIASAVLAPPGQEDASPAIQAAIDEVGAAGGGVVFLAAGPYRLGNPITVREGVTLRGDWAAPGDANARECTLLMVYCGRGEEDGPAAITLERGSGLREAVIWYPEQDTESVTPYPWTIHTSTDKGGDNYTVQNVTLVNPYKGIGVGPEWNELHTIRNVHGTPLSVGVFVDTCTDIGRLYDIRFDADVWTESGLPGAPETPAERVALATRLSQNAVAFDMGRSDWEYLRGLTARGYRAGLLVHEGAQGTTNAQMYDCHLTECAVALELTHLNGVGLMATGCTFSATEAPVLGAPTLANTAVQLSSCRLEGLGGCQAALVARGDATFTLQHCELAGWSQAGARADAGALALYDCTVTGPGAGMQLGARVRLARALGSAFECPDAIVGDCDPWAIERADGDMGFAVPDIEPYVPQADPKPKRAGLVHVSDYGVSPTLPDNTIQLQAALEAAGDGGGGTVYLPAGLYRCSGSLIVPPGVELRGVFDVPHHTMSAGSVLLPTGGRESEDGEPFLQLEPGSGLRGLTVWYPEQNPAEPVPYPWTVRALGPRCWIADVCLGNSWQGVDFWTHPSDGHIIRYLSGGFFRRGVFLSKCAGRGWLEDVQFNPHYMARIPDSLPADAFRNFDFGRVIAYQRANLTGIALGSCEDEVLCGTFLYAANDGLALLDDSGGPNATIIGHGTDTGSSGVRIEATGESGVDFLNAQLVPIGNPDRAAIVTEDGFDGRVRFFNTQVWAGSCTAEVRGSGEVLIQQVNTLSGPVELYGGKCEVTGVHFMREMEPQVTVGEGVTDARVIGNIAPTLLRLENRAGDRLYARANGLERPLRLDPGATYALATSWEPGEPVGPESTIADPGGGIRSVNNPRCRPVETERHTGGHALRVSGVADDPDYSYAYFRVLEGPIAVAPDTELSYWTRPENDRGRCMGIDVVFTDGSTLRQSPTQTLDGQGVHPGGPRGTVGEWTEIRIPLGAQHAGKTIEWVLFAYDSRTGGGEFSALIDDLSIRSDAAAAPFQPTIDPAPGRYPDGVTITLGGATGLRYTLDGTNPGPDSPRYEGPITLTEPGIWEIRFAPETPDGQVTDRVCGAVYEVGG